MPEAKSKKNALISLKNITRGVLLPIALSALLSGCCCAPRCPDTSTLIGLQSLTPYAITSCGKNGVNAIRLMALQQIALSTGAQAGLAWQSKQINKALIVSATTLDRVFNFNLMMLCHNVLPPVLVQGDMSLALDDDTTIRLADRTYKIVSQARFVTTPPTWRTYLWMDYPIPPAPAIGLLPQNSVERAVWKKYVAVGWQNGVDQANNIYLANLSLLKRDFTGMVRYRVLLAQHMVSPPFVAHTDLGITGGGSDMRINDQVLRITALPGLQANSKLWRPVLQP